MAKSKHHQFIDTIDEVLTDAIKKGIFHLYTEDEDNFSGRIIKVKGKELINFGLCGYLGLEIDERLKKGVIEAVLKHGTQFAASRAYISNGLYVQLEKLLNKIFDAYVVISPSTTLGHISAMPVVIEDSDVIILDQQVHSSVQTAAQLAKIRGVKVEMVRHNNLEQLEGMIKSFEQKYSKIWYLVDGVYSMYGDFAPIKELEQLQHKYKTLNLYIDDAHGMSWIGKNGSGYALSQIELNSRVIIVTSLVKAFGAGGGAIVCYDKELARKIRTCGSTLIFSGPIQNPMLGAGIASAKIHLSSDIDKLQQELKEKIDFTNKLIKQYSLPLVSESDSPIFFIGMGMPKVGYNMVKRLMDDGFYVNIGIFPGVPVKCTGLRVTITLHQTKDDIERLVKTIAANLPFVLQDENSSLNDIYKAFNIEGKYFKRSLQQNNNSFIIENKKSINDINNEEWNNLLGKNGSFDCDGLRFLEKVFSNNTKPEYNWEFNYLIIRDRQNEPIIATFYTTALWKEDMLAKEVISEKIEEERLLNPYYLTSILVSLGSLITEGQHMYINKNSSDWKSAFISVLKYMEEEQERVKATTLILRDFETDDEEIKQLVFDNGFIKADMPESNVIEIENWSTQEEFINTLSPKSRAHVRKIIRLERFFDIEIKSNVSEEEIDHFYHLQMNVKRRNFAINVFEYPQKLFYKMNEINNWEFIILYLKPEYDSRKDRKAVGVGVCYKGANNESYNGMLIGMDYDYASYNTYRVALLHTVLRAKALKYKRVNLGFSANTEKKKFGAKAIPKVAYIQAKDNFNMELIGLFSAEK